MGSRMWLLVLLCCGCVTGLQRWLQLTDQECQGCNQFYDDSAMFKSMLFVSSNTLILGGRNTLHSVDMITDTHSSYEDDSDTLETTVETCLNEGRIEDDCQNYYKVLLMLSATDVMTCGTWGYNPKCDVRSVEALDFRERAHVRPGNGFCPSSPDKPTSYLKLSQDGDIGFAGTCTEACTSDSITRFNLQPGSLSATSRTFNTKDMLSDPHFVYSFEEGDYVYFVFRETATELSTEKIYSRIGRVCANDVGSSSVFYKQYFLSYFKARFYCTSSQAGQQPFDHDEVDGAVYMDGVLYAAFSGPKNLQTGSIVCSYTIATIDDVFDGPYLAYDSDTREWVSTPNGNYNCANKKESPIQKYLMESSIHNLSPLFNTPSNERINGITADGFTYNSENIVVLYAASDTGRVHRIAFIKEFDSTVYDTYYKVGDSGVKDIQYGDGHVYAMGTNWITSIPVKQGCSAASCSECVGAHFPYCGWCYDVEQGQWSCSTRTKCQLRNWMAPTDTCKPLPTFSNVPKNLTLREGDTAQFRCSSHEAEVVWSKDGGKLPQKAGYINPVPQNIYIPEVKLEDTGFYECSVNNTSGVVTARGYLYVQVPARFQEVPTNVTVSYGHQDLVLTCRAQGLPKPEIWWERSNGALPDGSAELPNGDLKIIRVMGSDEGAYSCFIRNDISGLKQSEPAYVTVLDKSGPYTPAADESSYNTPISITVLTIGIVISAIVCFIIGLTVHILYRRRKQKRERSHSSHSLSISPPSQWTSPASRSLLLQDMHHKMLRHHKSHGMVEDFLEAQTPHGHGTYSQFSMCPHQDEAGYLCPNQNNWSNTMQSFHRHPTGLSMSGGPFTPIDSAMSNLMTDEEAPPAYSPNTFTTSMSEWYPSGTAHFPSAGTAHFPAAGTIECPSRDYAEIIFPGPPPVAPPLLPAAMQRGLPGHNTVPVNRDYSPTHHNTSPRSREFLPATHGTVPASRDLMAGSREGYPHRLGTTGLISDYSTKLNVSSAI